MLRSAGPWGVVKRILRGADGCGAVCGQRLRGVALVACSSCRFGPQLELGQSEVMASGDSVSAPMAWLQRALHYHEGVCTEGMLGDGCGAGGRIDRDG